MSVRSRVALLLAVAALAAAGVAALPGTGASAAGSAAPAEQSPASNGLEYTAPSGPELTSSRIGGIALEYARTAGDAQPESISAAQGTFAAAQAALEPGAPLAAQSSLGRTPSGGEVPVSGAMQAWLNSSAYLVVMRGHFTPNLPVPTGRTLPRGSVYAMILDAHTGFPEARYVGPAAIDAAALGAVSDLTPAGTAATEARAASTSTAGRSGIVGRARDSAGAPGRHWRVLVLSGQGPRVSMGVLARTRTGSDGRFGVRIKPGDYLVEAFLPDGERCFPSVRARVRAYRKTSLTLGCSAT